MNKQDELRRLYASDAAYHRFRNMAAEMGQFLIERDAAIELALAALLVKHNVLLISAPGEVKTTLCNLLGAAIRGARVFTVELFKLTGPEFIFGPPDMGLYESAGVFRYRTKGMAPDAHIIFLDELFSGNAAVVQGTASLSNPAQRTFCNADLVEQCPAFTVYGATNELPDFREDPELLKIYDRYLFRLVLSAVQEKEGFLKLLEAEIPWRLSSSVTLEELQGLQEAVKWVAIPHELKELRWALRKRLDEAGVWISSRRWRWTSDAIRASAFLAKRPVADLEDLLILQHVLWNDRGRERLLVVGLIVEVVFPKLHEAYGHLSRAYEQLALAKEGKSLQERVVEIQRLRALGSALLAEARPGYETEQVAAVLLGIGEIGEAIHQIASQVEGG